MQKSRSLSVKNNHFFSTKKSHHNFGLDLQGGGELSMHASVFPPNVGHSTSTFGGADLVDPMGFVGRKHPGSVGRTCIFAYTRKHKNVGIYHTRVGMGKV